MRIWCSGNIGGFQPLVAGSTPAIRTLMHVLSSTHVVNKTLMAIPSLESMCGLKNTASGILLITVH